MHEWALAEGVVLTARELAEREGMRRVTRLVVRVGELQRISPEFFRKAIDAVLPADDERLAGVELELELEPTSFTCRGCSKSFTLAEVADDLDDQGQEAVHFVPELAHGYLRCPSCEHHDFDVGSGRGIWIDRLEGER